MRLVVDLSNDLICVAARCITTFCVIARRHFARVVFHFVGVPECLPRTDEAKLACSKPLLDIDELKAGPKPHLTTYCAL